VSRSVVNYVNVIHKRVGHTSEWATQPKTRLRVRPYLVQPPTMPPKRPRSARNSIEQEGRTLLAIQAIKNNEITSIREAARRFDVPRNTLTRRLTGVIPRVDIRANSHKLTQNEEESLEKWILNMDARGAAPRPSMVADMANLLLAKRGETPIQTVGQNWVTNYVKRHPGLSSRYSKRYNYERAKMEDPKVIQAWFDLVQKTIL
jgi:hypothetical protein